MPNVFFSHFGRFFFLCVCVLFNNNKNYKRGSFDFDFFSIVMSQGRRRAFTTGAPPGEYYEIPVTKEKKKKEKKKERKVREMEDYVSGSGSETLTPKLNRKDSVEKDQKRAKSPLTLEEKLAPSLRKRANTARGEKRDKRKNASDHEGYSRKIEKEEGMEMVNFGGRRLGSLRGRPFSSCEGEASSVTEGMVGKRSRKVF